jgi:hypothetical protein
MNLVVIARYNEDMGWITQIPSDFEIIIYNKGEAITDQALIQRCRSIIPRPNIGRESETYASHILSHDKDDEDFTVFTQGGVLEHSPDFIRALQSSKDWSDVQALSWLWRADRNTPPQVLLDHKQRLLDGKPRLRPETFSLELWGPLDFPDPGASNLGLIYRTLNNIPPSENIAAHMLKRLQRFDQAKQASLHKVGIFSYGAIFAVKNRLIHKVPLEAREALRRVAIEPIAANGYILERLWLHIFGHKFEIPL